MAEVMSERKGKKGDRKERARKTLVVNVLTHV